MGRSATGNLSQHNVYALRLGRSLALAGVLTCAWIVGAQAATCGPQLENASAGERSVAVRRLQTKLMVAALSCGAKSEYNDFVLHYRPHLKRHGTALKAKFRAEYGGSYQKRLDSFVTALANQASQRSNKDRAAFCADAKATFASLKGGDSLTAGLADRSAMNLHYAGPQLACASAKRR